MFEEQKRLAAIQSDEIEEAVEEAESDADDDIILPEDDESTRGIKSFFKKAFHSRAQSEEDMREIGYEDDDESDDSDTYENTGAQDTEKHRKNRYFQRKNL